jgi:hypothetical protein
LRSVGAAKYGSRLTGYYVGGKRVRRYFLRREEAATFLRAESMKRENLGNRAEREGQMSDADFDCRNQEIPAPSFGFDFTLAIERAPHPRMPLKARPLLFRCNSPSPAEICDLHPLTSSFLLLNFTRRPPSALSSNFYL